MCEPLQTASAQDLDELLALVREYCEFDRLPFDECHARATVRELLGSAALGRVWFIVEKGCV